MLCFKAGLVLTRSHTLLCLGLFGLIAVPTTVRAASFDCSQASTVIEHAVCADPDLATTDVKLAAAYKAALAIPYADHDTVKNEQLSWLRDRDKRCKPSDPAGASTDAKFLACLQKAYDNRLRQLTVTPENKAACLAVGAALTAATLAVQSNAHSIADIAAGVPGSALRLDSTIEGYVLKSSYVGSLSCQNPHLFQTVDGHASEVDVPAEFAPEEGSHCGADTVRLASVNGSPALLDELTSAGGSGQSTIRMSLRARARWTDACSIDVTTSATYQVAVASCADESCEPLAALARQYSNANHGVLAGQQLPSAERLPADERPAYAELVSAASRQNLADSYEVPLFGDPASQAARRSDGTCSLSFDGLGGVLFPVVSADEMMLGKIGQDGFGLGAHSGGPNDAIVFYRLVAGELQPVAGFCAVAGPRIVTSVHAY